MLILCMLRNTNPSTVLKSKMYISKQNIYYWEHRSNNLLLLCNSVACNPSHCEYSHMLIF